MHRLNATLPLAINLTSASGGTRQGLLRSLEEGEHDLGVQFL